MGNLGRNIQFGLRMLLRNKGFAAIAMLVLALGIGPNVAIFSIVWATFLAPLPYPNSDQLVVVWSKVKGERSPSPADEYEMMFSRSRSFAFLGFGSWTDIPHLTGPDHIQEEISGIAATPGFQVNYLKLRLAMGRDFLPAEGAPGNNHEIVLTHNLWENRYHSDPAILGKSITVDEEPYTVVGVLEAGVADRIPMQFYTPVALDPAAHNAKWGNIEGRLEPGVSIAQAQAELAILDRQYSAEHPDQMPKEGVQISVEPLHNDWMDKKIERNLWLLLGAVGFVLLIACADLANLLLARGASRQQEIAVRAALGASRSQVFAQLITESLTLAIFGGAIGIALGWVMMKTAMAVLPLVKFNAEAIVEINLPVLCFAVFATLIAGVVSGCAPAWQASKLNLSEMLKQGSRSVTGRGRARTQSILVVTEFALALTLLAGAGMALHSFWNLTHVDLGVRTDHILMGRLQARRFAPGAPLPNGDLISANARQLLSKVSALPGVQNAAMTSSLPLEGQDQFPFTIAGHPVAANTEQTADLEIVTPSYFTTFGVQLLQGRLLSDNDLAGGPQAVMVSESFVKRYLRGENPLDQRLQLAKIVPGQKIGTASDWQIVGVFHAVRNGEHLNDESTPEMFISFWQSPLPWMGLAVRTTLEPASISRDLRVTVAQTMPGYAFSDIRTMQESIDTQVTGDRFGMVLFGLFAVLALLLAALGIYGVMAFSVLQRKHEIGLRMALGAQQADVVRMILIDGMKLALIGAGIGLAGVYLLGRLMHGTLYGVNTLDAASFAAVAVALLAVAFVASWLPARRSAKIDPMIALRQE